MSDPLDELAARAQSDLERALRGASLCAVSRDPSVGSTSVKFLEGRWYTLQAIRRRLVAEPGLTWEQAAQVVAAESIERTPTGAAWAEYAAGAASATDDVCALPPGSTT